MQSSVPCLLNAYHHARLLNACQLLNLMKKADSWNKIDVKLICSQFTFRWLMNSQIFMSNEKIDLVITSWSFWLRNRWEWPFQGSKRKTQSAARNSHSIKYTIPFLKNIFAERFPLWIFLIVNVMSEPLTKSMHKRELENEMVRITIYDFIYCCTKSAFSII